MSSRAWRAFVCFIGLHYPYLHTFSPYQFKCRRCGKESVGWGSWS